eukprot:COSAG01_NODE_3189_length_6441_cov_8.086566_6_plen_39_part_00
MLTDRQAIARSVLTVLFFEEVVRLCDAKAADCTRVRYA